MSAPVPEEAIRKALPDATEIEPLDGGGQGFVWRVVVAGREEALKLLDPAKSDRADREVAALQAISSPYVMRFYGTLEIEHDGQRCQAIRGEFISGGTVHSKLAADERPDAEGALAFVQGLVRGLGEIHATERGHRDIKPQNIAVRDGRWEAPVILDLGLARDLLATSITAYPGQLGTAVFMAPEQLRGERAPRRSDIFAAGVVLFVLSVGRHPFMEDGETLSVDELLARQEAAEWPIWDGVDDRVRRVMEPMLAFEANARPRAGSVLNLIEEPA
ncbi:MAG: serine/threonine-protein kinase [Solirubrobacterales bacterium]